MPTYEYQCLTCTEEFEVEQRITDPARAQCPSCGSWDTRRLISHSSFVLKGSGWYVTDYGRKGGSSSTRTKTTVTESSSDNKTKASESKP